jgi:hypothetical protein
VSDLQLSLLVIGAMVVGAVCVYNWVQERNLRRRLRQAFGDVPDDVLLRRGEEAPGGAGRVEPQLQQSRIPQRPLRQDSGSLTPRHPPATAASGFDAELDYVVELQSDAPIPEAAIAELLSKIGECGKPARALGISPDTGEWEEVTRESGRRYGGLRLGLQLVNRSGPVNTAQLALFCDAARSCAEKASAVAVCPDARAALEAARELDAFCSRVDVAVGVNVVAQEGVTFPGAGIREFAEAAGFKLEPDGVFHYRNEERQTLFTLDNHEPAPFLPEQIKQLTTRGITLMLDVPRVADGTVLDRMIDIGRDLAAGMGGTLVDDNRNALSEAGIGRIREQLRSIHAALAARGMPAGGPHALRLFS